MPGRWCQQPHQTYPNCSGVELPSLRGRRWKVAGDGCWFIGSCCITFHLEDSEDSEDLDDLWWLLMTYDDLWLGTWNGNGIPQKDVACLRPVSWYSLITRHVRSSMQRETRWQHGENGWEWDGWILILEVTGWCLRYSDFAAKEGLWSWDWEKLTYIIDEGVLAQLFQSDDFSHFPFRYGKQCHGVVAHRRFYHLVECQILCTTASHPHWIISLCGASDTRCIIKQFSFEKGNSKDPRYLVDEVDSNCHWVIGSLGVPLEVPESFWTATSSDISSDLQAEPTAFPSLQPLGSGGMGSPDSSWHGKTNPMPWVWRCLGKTPSPLPQPGDQAFWTSEPGDQNRCSIAFQWKHPFGAENGVPPESNDLSFYILNIRPKV